MDANIHIHIKCMKNLVERISHELIAKLNVIMSQKQNPRKLERKNRIQETMFFTRLNILLQTWVLGRCYINIVEMLQQLMEKLNCCHVTKAKPMET